MLNRFLSWATGDVRTRGARPLALAAVVMMVAALVPGVLRGGVVAAAGIGGSLLLFLGLWAETGRLPLWATRSQRLGGGLLLVMAALTLDATFPALSGHALLKLTSIFVPLALLDNPALIAALVKYQPRLLKALPVLLLLGFVLLDGALLRLYAAPVLSEDRLTKYNRGLTYGLLFLWPVLSILFLDEKSLKKRVLLSVCLGVLVVPALAGTHSRAGQVGFVAAVIAFPLSFYFPAVMRGLLAMGVGLSTFWPLAARALFSLRPHWVAQLPDSWRARVEIWDYLSYRIAEKSWFGWGLGAVPRLSPDQPHGNLYLFTKIPPAHAHNYITSLGVEMGSLGMAGGVFLTLVILRRTRRLPLAMQPFALSAFIVGWGLALVAYDFWTDSLLAALALTGFWFAWQARGRSELRVP